MGITLPIFQALMVHLNTLAGVKTTTFHAAPTEIDTIAQYAPNADTYGLTRLIRNYHVDPDRININGHSMGSRGTTMMAKAFPDHYASATSLNNGAIDDDPPALSDVVYGPTSMNFPTNLTDYNGNTVPFTHAMDYTTRLSKKRDLPLMRFYHAKNDNDGTTTGNSWDADVVANFRAPIRLHSVRNSIERAGYGPDTGPSHNDSLVEWQSSTQQTVLDDIAYEEEYFRSDVSFPAFFNHRLDPQNNDPGTGLTGINNGDGDNWGTWGGYHRWENVQENNLDWQTTAWLESNAVYSNDNCPNDFLTADLAIRKPRNFKPTGTLVYWQVRDFDTNQMLQNGTTMVQADDLTVIPQVKVFRNDIRKVRIEVSTQTVATKEVESNLFSISISPNPSTETSMLTVYSEKELNATLRLSHISGVMLIVEKQTLRGENHIPLIDFGPVPAGFYFITIEADRQQKVVRWVKI
ncbi:MAG: T9SS type A sorting domain-containing protein [Saprospiraceae bacterium]|uniref:T9SS type A sorting domain-containing protein n=1 Tax=Candidatus Opimibacter skivensis TaxID=2982028 RepID=A0A9D7SXN6_9BACT|nr:T9SS type A sorting domain-containing protein [Candidatus Opimibacter skivensis]